MAPSANVKGAWAAQNVTTGVTIMSLQYLGRMAVLLQSWHVPSRECDEDGSWHSWL